MFRVIFAKSSLYKPLQSRRLKCQAVKTFYVRGFPWFLFESIDKEEIRLPASLVKFRIYKDGEGFIWAHDPSPGRRFNIDLF